MLWFKKKKKDKIPKSGPAVYHSPCALGDDIYIVRYEKGVKGLVTYGIEYSYVNSIEFRLDEHKEQVMYIGLYRISDWWEPSDFGTTLFLSEEEAKDKLKYILTKEVMEK